MPPCTWNGEPAAPTPDGQVRSTDARPAFVPDCRFQSCGTQSVAV
jgi:hypothetical protein